ncbi:MAG: methyltransferase domain-containing protein [Rhodospirillales bacterium]|nr:methyltransferase domain-containing protein [Rhodospirillales bacterium]
MSAPAFTPAHTIFDRSLLKIRRQRAAPLFLHSYDFLHRHAAALMNERLRDIKRSFPVAAYCGAPLPREEFLSFQQTAGIEFLAQLDVLPMAAQADFITALQGDEEFFPFGPEALDLAISNLNLHQTNDLPGTLIQIRRALRPDGLFLAAMLGGETLWQLRDSLSFAEQQLSGGISPRVHPFADKQQMGALLQRAGFALPVVDSEKITVTYQSLPDLVKDLRGLSETNMISNRNKSFRNRHLFKLAEMYYAEHFTESSGRLEATFEMIFMIGWAPHAAQPQPLRPGSAKIRLADALKTEEVGM